MEAYDDVPVVQVDKEERGYVIEVAASEFWMRVDSANMDAVRRSPTLVDVDATIADLTAIRQMWQDAENGFLRLTPFAVAALTATRQGCIREMGTRMRTADDDPDEHEEVNRLLDEVGRIDGLLARAGDVA